MAWWMLNTLKDDLIYKVILSLLQIKDKFYKKLYTKICQMCNHYQKICDKLKIATKSKIFKNIQSRNLSILGIT